MSQIKRITLNDMPKWFKLFVLILPIMGYFLIANYLNNDFYFMYPTGEHIVNNGFPVKDILSMHSSMSIVIQQWLTCVLFYFAYSHFGKAGVLFIVYVCYTVFCALVYLLIKTITDNFIISGIFAFIIDLFVSTMYMATRPQIFTYLILLAELLLLEKFVKTNKTVFLLFIPLLSVLLVNFHASMWLMIFVLAAPYGVAAISVKLGKIKQEPCCSFIKLIICGIVCFAVGFINPYGLKGMTYIFTSFGKEDVNLISYEMSSMSLSDGIGIVFTVIVAIMLAALLLNKKKEFSTRFVLLFVGTIILAVMNIKSVSSFLIAGVPAYSYAFKNVEPRLTVAHSKTNKSKKPAIILAIMLVFVSIAAAYFIVDGNKNATAPVTAARSDYAVLDDMAEIMNKSGDDIILYADIDWGPYMEFRGFRPYIDDRIELFIKDNNNEFDYLKEYIDVSNMTINYSDFVNKYGFNYLIVSNRSPHFKQQLLDDNGFEVLYQENGIVLFRAKE